jgi:hypothetical protein
MVCADGNEDRAPPTRDTEPDPPAPASGSTPHSVPCTVPPAVRTPVPGLRPSHGQDTLLSAPTPADAAELELEDRLVELSRRVASVEARLEELEGRVPKPHSRERGLVVAGLLLLALALAWPVVRYLASH